MSLTVASLILSPPHTHSPSHSPPLTPSHITSSLTQFHRSFPGPADVTPVEIKALAQRYYDPATGLHNYLQFHNDVVRVGEENGSGLGKSPHAPVVKKPEVASLDEIFARIRDAVYKNGIRTTEFFRDHDKLRSGVITENQVHVHVHTKWAYYCSDINSVFVYMYMYTCTFTTYPC